MVCPKSEKYPARGKKKEKMRKKGKRKEKTIERGESSLYSLTERSLVVQRETGGRICY
jgi:hypothetical protein